MERVFDSLMKTFQVLTILYSVISFQAAALAGNWQVVPSANGARQVNELHGVSALADDDVWAVGVSYNTERTISNSLIEHWNGSSWSVIPSPNPSSSLNILSAVAAVAPDDVWAVGLAATVSSGAIIMHWNGMTWSVTPNPAAPFFMSNLMSLAVISANDIWAVGSGRMGDEDVTLTLHWNGTAWSFIPSPNVQPEVDNALFGVSAVASNDVWAVGTQQPTSLTDPHTLVLHWNGAAWSIIPSANDGGSRVGNHLLATAAVATDNAWAVGYSEFGPLAEHWDGMSWNLVSTATAPHREPLFLSSVTALSNTNVWTVGEGFRSGTTLSRTLTERWNGKAWLAVNSPNVGSDHNELFGVSATATGNLWSVGTTYHYPLQRTLIVRKQP